MSFLKQKTTWAALALIATTLLPQLGISWLTPERVHAIQITIAGLTAIFARQAVAKIEKEQK